MPKQIQVKGKKSKLPPRGWRRRFAVKTVQAPKKSLFRRILRLFFNPITVISSLLITFGVVLTLGYFWFDYSDRIDLFLKGDVFTNSAGIYSAPKTLRDGESISIEDLTAYLKSAGYIEKTQQAAASRSRYQTGDNRIEIEPGATAMIDGEKAFHALAVEFKKDGKSIEKITDTDANKTVKQTPLEPQILSSVAAEGDGRRKVVTFQDLPPTLVKAITATEDRAFFEHYGVNLRGIARALWRRYEKDDENSRLKNQGGSSITQQLVKNLLLSNEQTLERKIKEAYMSIILETKLSKQEIFTLYANQIYLGQQNGVSIYGVGEAANAYFGKDVSQLTLPEAAFVAGIIRSPNRYNPYKNLPKVTERRNQVLDSMTEANEISAEQATAAKGTTLDIRKITNGKDSQGMPYFSQFAVEELPKITSDPETLQRSRVYTTIDPDLQKAAYRIVNERLEKLDKHFPKKRPGNLQAALVAIRPKTGEIVAMVGGRDYLETQFNRATDAERQPGSVFKPFVYATAINSAYEMNSRVMTPATIFKDEKQVFTFGNATYSPNNYGDEFSKKDLTLRDALVKSKNTITVGLGMELNIGRVMNLADKAGLPKPEKAYPSMALGTNEATPLQVATGYTVFANLGDKVTPLPISRITDGAGRTINAPVAEKKNVLHSDVAFIMDDIMKDVINRGTAAGAKAWGFKNVAGKTAFAGKTGTSRDGWFAGFTPEIVCVVYVGFDDNDDLGMTGADSAMPIWADFMREALDEHPEWNGDWQMPESVKKAEIDTRNGSLIRELSNAEADTAKTEQAVLLKNKAKQNANQNSNQNTNPDLPLDGDDLTLENKPLYVTEVPPEFRRVELFIVGTVPNKTLLPVKDELTDTDLTAPQPTETPFQTWQDAGQNTNSNRQTLTPDHDIPPVAVEQTVTLAICPLTGMRATANCPDKRLQTFKKGEEPQEFCTFHVGK
ncbi:MAG: PBP1A family penicillin-binding protein [Acidobacteriota bacterium]|nr:PBP1A family penicillin-binding protein [Acidobacteriota bacterium]